MVVVWYGGMVVLLYTYQSILHVFVFDVFARRDAVGDVEVNEFTGQFGGGGQTIDHLGEGGGEGESGGVRGGGRRGERGCA